MEPLLGITDFPKCFHKILEPFNPLVSERVGIINAVIKRDMLSKYGYTMYQCLSTKVSVLAAFTREPSSGGMGISLREKDAILACFGEAIERYCMSFIPTKDLFSGTLPTMSQEFYNSHLLDFYTEEQYRLHPSFTNGIQDPIEWVSISKIDDKDSSSIWPAGLIYIPYESHKTIGETSSSGIAAHSNLETAYESALCEVIERDALMIYFYSGIPATKITPESIGEDIVPAIKDIIKDFNILLYQLETDTSLRVYLGYIFSKDGDFHYGIGASAALDSDVAVGKVIKECLFSYHYSLNLTEFRNPKKEKITQLVEHFLYFQDSILFEKIVLPINKETSYQRKVLSFKDLLSSIRESGYEIYVKDLTTPDILNSNIRVVRTIIPGYVDLNKTYTLPKKTSRRFLEVAEKLGYPNVEIDFSVLHPLP